MEIPLPRVIPDVGPGGGIVTAMNGINSLANNMVNRRINEIKEFYAPLTTQAEAASKLAYANLINPQYIAKIMSNPHFMGNLSEEQKNMLNDLSYNAAVRNQNPASVKNSFNYMQRSSQDGIFTRWLKNSLRNMIESSQESETPVNALSQNYSKPEAQSELSQNPMQHRPKDGVILEGQQWYNAKGEPVYESDVETSQKPIELELTERKPSKTYEQKAGDYLGGIKQGEKSGEIRAQNLGDIGEEMKVLDATGANIDRLINGFTNPDFMALRETFPFMQDTQLSALSKTGNPEVRYMIGKLISDIEAFKGSTVNSFKGQTLKREFDYADKLKPSESDTVYTALGKLQTLKALHDIAWLKDMTIKNYMQNKGMSLADAVERANKEVNVKAIDEAVKEYTQPLYPIRNKKTHQTIMVPKKRMELLLTKGVKYG